jgi:hypothetical protein
MPLPGRVPKRKSEKVSQQPPGPFCKITTRLDNIGPPQPAKDRFTEYYISPGKVCKVSPGCIVWLPAKDRILSGAIVDRRVHAEAFNHPAVILSVPTPLTGYA